jgi:hypothetical protein
MENILLHIRQSPPEVQTQNLGHGACLAYAIDSDTDTQVDFAFP